MLVLIQNRFERRRFTKGTVISVPLVCINILFFINQILKLICLPSDRLTVLLNGQSFSLYI